MSMCWCWQTGFQSLAGSLVHALGTLHVAYATRYRRENLPFLPTASRGRNFFLSKAKPLKTKVVGARIRRGGTEWPEKECQALDSELLQKG